MLENMGCWQKETKIEKTVGCFKVPLGSLGLTELRKCSKHEKHTFSENMLFKAGY